MGRIATMDAGEPSAAGRHPALIAAVVGLVAVGAVTVAYHRGASSTQGASHADPEPTQATSNGGRDAAALLERSQASRRALDVDAMAPAEAALAAAIAAEPTADDADALRLELAHLLGARALEAAIHASIAPDDPKAASRVEAATRRASALVDELEQSGTDGADLRVVRARLELARGEDVSDLSPMLLLTGGGDPELRLAMLAAPVWRDPAAPVDEDLLLELQGADSPGVMVALLMAIALERSGDAPGARRVTDEILELVPSQPTATVLADRLRGDSPVVVASSEPTAPAAADAPARGTAARATPAEPRTEDPAPRSEPTRSEPGPPVAPPSPPPAAEPTAEPEPEPEMVGPAPRPEATVPEPAPVQRPRARPSADPTKKGGTPESARREGCKLVRAGETERGLKMLRWAHDRKPGDPTIVLCMAEANQKLGRAATALALSERILRGSPKHKGALRLAAKLEAQRGNTRAAVAHYRRLLELAPDDPTAKAYIEKHGQ